MKLFGWPSDSGACKFYRTALPMRALDGWDGHETRMCPDGVYRLPRDVKEDPDWLVVLQRSDHPSARQTFELFGQLDRPFVWDVDDDLWSVEHDNPAFGRFSHPQVRANLDWMVEHAAVVTCSTEPLAERLRVRRAGPIHVLPNALDEPRLDPVLDERDPVVFWRGSPTHDRDVDLVGFALQRAERRGVQVVLAGQDYRARLGLKSALMLEDYVLAHPELGPKYRKLLRAVPSERDPRKPRLALQLTPYEYLRFVRDLVRPTVALCPLRSSAFNDAKSHIAALEAHAVGAVAITSAMPAFDWYMAPLEYGLRVRNREQDWHRALQDVLDLDYAGWRALAEAGAARARETSVETLRPDYAKAYQEAAGG